MGVAVPRVGLPPALRDVATLLSCRHCIGRKPDRRTNQPDAPPYSAREITSFMISFVPP